MPRVNPLRTITNERNLATRIRHERERREWSYEGFAHRMSEAGYPIQPSAIFKIEKGDPPRRITVDELVGFAATLGTSVEELLQPLEVVSRKELVRLLKTMSKAADATIAADSAYKDALRALIAYTQEHPEVQGLLAESGVDLQGLVETLERIDDDIDAYQGGV